MGGAVRVEGDATQTLFRPALRAIIWGFCREGRFVPVDDNGDTLSNEAVLNKAKQAQTRLKLLPSNPPDQCLKEGGFKETTESVADGIIHLREANQQLQSSIDGLREDVQLIADTDIHSDAVSELLGALIEELTDASEAAANRLDSIRAQENICDTVEETNEIQEWFDEEVTDVWNRRLETLYRFDAELTIGSSQFEWVTDDIQTAIDQQRTALDGHDGSWWTTDGWQTLMAETTTDIGDAIQQSWSEYVETEGLSSLVDRIDEHPWVVPATDLPSSVQDAFEREYITPLRNLQRWYNTMDEAIASLTTDTEDVLVAATDSLAGMSPYSESMDYTTEALAAKIDRLTAVVGDRTPDDVAHIGNVPDDRQSIDQRLERLVEDRELDIEAVDSGVVIR
jgi:DNA repair ATPase RecN